MVACMQGINLNLIPHVLKEVALKKEERRFIYFGLIQVYDVVFSYAKLNWKQKCVQYKPMLYQTLKYDF